MPAGPNGVPSVVAPTDYEAPRLTVLGSVVELTQKGAGTDGGGLGGNNAGAGTGGSMM